MNWKKDFGGPLPGPGPLTDDEREAIDARQAWGLKLPKQVGAFIFVDANLLAFTDAWGNFLLALPPTGTPVGDLEEFFNLNFGGVE